MQFRNILPAIALLAPLAAAQEDGDTPIVSAFLDYMQSEGLSSLSAEGFTAAADLYGSLVDSIESVMATAEPSDREFVESYVSSAVFADPTLSSVVASITAEYGDDDATPAATGSSGDATPTATSDGAATTGAESEDAGVAVDARHMGVVSGVVGAAVLGFAVLL